jgi:hypothetical protein
LGFVRLWEIVGCVFAEAQPQEDRGLARVLVMLENRKREQQRHVRLLGAERLVPSRKPKA